MRAVLCLGLLSAVLICSGTPAIAEDKNPAPQKESKPEEGELVGVLCAWDLYIMAGAALTECAPKEKALISSIDTAIGRMNEFIIHNSPKKLAEGETTRATEERHHFYLGRIREDKASQPDLCQKMRQDPVVDIMYRMGPKGIKKDMDTLLATARPPSKDPCW